MIIAKTRPIKSLEEHTNDVLHRFSELLSSGYLAREFIEKYKGPINHVIHHHDIGKIGYKFQSKLHSVSNVPFKKIKDLECLPDYPHGWLSMALMNDSFEDYGELFPDILRYIVSHHHERRVEFNIKNMREIVMKDLKTLSLRYFNVKFNIEKIYMYDVEHIKKEITENYDECFKHIVYVKGALHKCDYCASGEIPVEQKFKGDYNKLLNTFIINRFGGFKRFQEDVSDLTDKSIVMVASTGIGKTEYAMKWLNGDKSFYLLGIKTAVNDIYKRFVNIFNKDNVALLHGETSFLLLEDSDSEIEEDYFSNLSKIRMLSYPITIATADQLVPSVFKFPGYELAYFTLSYSKIVIDEIQSFAPKSIASIVVFLKEVHSFGGKFLLMTATLPQFIKDEFKDMENISFPTPELSKIKRHKIKTIKDQINSDAVTQIINKNKDKKILIICNTVKKAQEMYELHSGNLFHSRYIVCDRRNKENELSIASKRDHPCIWITTQVVEASLDIDFDILITEAADATSIFQRLGRVFRTREYRGIEPNVYITYADNTSYNLVYEKELVDRTFKCLSSYQYDNKFLTECDKQDIIDFVYDKNFLEGTKYYKEYSLRKKILESSIVKNGINSESKSDARKKFREFFSQYVLIPKSIYDANKVHIDNILDSIDNNNLTIIERLKNRSALMSYTLSLNLNEIKESRLYELLVPINTEFCRKNKINIVNVEYSHEKGLSSF